MKSATHKLQNTYHTFSQSAPHSPNTFYCVMFLKMLLAYYCILTYTKTVSSILAFCLVTPTGFGWILSREFKKVQPRSNPITIIFKAAALSCSTLFPLASLFPSFSVSLLFSFFICPFSDPF